MAKKQKRQVARSAAPVIRERAEVVQQSVQETPASAPRSASYTRAAPSAADFNPDYSYVKSDLKRIGILASSFIVILVVLSFFLR